MNPFSLPGDRSRGRGGHAAPRRRALRRHLAAVLGCALLPGLLTPVAFAAAAEPLGRPELDAPRAADVTPFRGELDRRAAEALRRGEAAGRADAERAAQDQDRRVTWPGPGSATLALPRTGTAGAAPGGLPVTLAPSGSRAGAAAGTVRATVLDQHRAAALGIRGVVLTVTGPASGGGARLGVDYTGFAGAYGGDWAGRLRLVRLPDCALTDPAKPACRTRTPLASVNHRRDERLDTPLTFPAAPAATPAPAARKASFAEKATATGKTAAGKATVGKAVTGRAPAAGRAMVLAVAAEGSSGGGDHKASPLSASATWEAGGSSGTFTWSYPLRVPPAAAGPAPDLSISYDSGSVDGRTATTNNQGSVVGEGFDLTSSFIERSYGSCDDDGQDDKHDLCWKYENASLVLNGRASELVKDDTSGQWRLKNDDASTVVHHQGTDGADNGDEDREYWTVTTGNGTVYHFGLNKLPGATTQATQSVWTVPVFGDDKDEPGYDKGAAFKDRWEKQAWRWNLDYVEDTHGNAMSYWYAAEQNHYDLLGDDDTGTPYTRGGILKEIRYGQRKDSLFAAPAASDRVLFAYAERCEKTGTGCDSLTEDTRDNWPDVPFDAECKADVKCTGNVGPSFYTRKRMTGITTEAWDSSATTPAYVPVDSWALKQKYLDPGDTGDATDQSLWLDEIRHTGRRGTAVTLPPVTFTHQWRPNRVDGNSDDILPLNRPRLYTITSETGAVTVVDYRAADCLAGRPRPKPDANTGLCYPVNWAPNGGKEKKLDWFHKYPVTSVTTSDRSGAALPVEDTYSYAGGGAWHYNDDPLTKEKDRTWSVWRGFERVTHTTGLAGRTQSRTVTVHLRGMNGDRVLGPDGKSPDPDKRKTVTVTGVKAGPLTDTEQYAGFTRETVTYNGDQEVSGTVNDPWSKRTATQHKSYADAEAYYVRTGASHARTALTNGPARDRVRTVETAYDAYGMAYQVTDKGDDDRTGDETCVRTWYARNDAKGLNNLVSRARTTAGVCGADGALDLPADASRPGDVISDTAVAYDSTSWSDTQTPTLGEPRWTGRAKGYGIDGRPQWQRLTTTGYDALGRPLVIKDTNDTTTATTAYTPAVGGPLTATTTTDAKGYATATQLDFATGAATKTTDPNKKITETEYDALGRITKVWLPNQPTSIGKKPNYVYAYGISATAPSWVSTGTLTATNAGEYNTTFEIYDGLLRTRQVQAPTTAGGRVIAETLYDERGLATTTNTDIWDEKNAPSGTLVATDGGQAPVQTDTAYDGAGRAVSAVTKTYGTARWSTRTTYTGDTVTATAPPGGQATAVVTDALGRTTERREYGGPQPAGDDFTRTAYTYTPAGQQRAVTGPDGAAWAYTYDLFGRQVTSQDPDKGASRTGYDEFDRAVTATDGRGRTLTTEYDLLGRRTGLWDGAAKTDAAKLAAWTFDTLAKGLPDASVRYENGVNQPTSRAYTQKVTSYDALYRATGSQLILPDTDPLVAAGVPKTLSSSVHYTPDGNVLQAGQPAAGGLPSEIVSYEYTPLGQPLSAAGKTGYFSGAVYSPLGDLRQLALSTSSASTAKKSYLTYEYEPGTRRLTGASVTDDVHAYKTQDLRFRQDDAGNVTSISDPTTRGGTAKADHQCFRYDGHRRLTEAWTPRTADCAAAPALTALDGAAPYWTGYTYNTAGQRTSETEHTPAGDRKTAYTYGTPAPAAQPHALTATTGARPATYTYDRAGNTTNRPGGKAQQTLTWNAEGKLATTTEATASTGYLYDASGALLIRRASGDGDTVLYLGGMEVRLTVKGATKTLSASRYYSAGDRTIAVRTATAGSTTSTLTFLAGDHHGTAGLTIDPATLAVTKRYTTPFGAPRGPKPTAWPDDKAFLGAPADTTTGLTHIGAREYDPATGQFLSVDPLLTLDQHQSLNGYSYANNTPVTLSDPSGLAPDDCGRGGFSCHPTNSGDWEVTPNSDYVKYNPGAKNTGRKPKAPSPNDIQAATNPVNIVEEAITETATYYFPKTVDYAAWRSGYNQEISAIRADHGDVTADDLIATALNLCVGPGGDKCPDGMRNILWDMEWLRISQYAGYEDRGAVVRMPVGNALRANIGSVRGMGSTCFRNSFTPETKVLMADGTAKEIKDVRVGDRVMATDPETGETAPKEIEAEIRGVGRKDLVKVTLEIGGKHVAVTATEGHPFWVPALRKWVDAGKLNVRQWLLTGAGTRVQITAIERWAQQATVYNLTVADLHTYYVLAGATPVLVHNSNCVVGGAPGSRPGKPFTPAGKGKVVDANEDKYGVPTCEICGKEVVRPKKSQRGVTPPENEWQIDHIQPKSRGGSGDPSNGQVLCRVCNREKSDN
ncbi:polymorphic toxin-type HINT domain-containing protein [Streptomyces sp. LP05-1]|uniref:Polymorphic toxin-type HINT domain-containing protein n=1 Tax=Streptomyces pyxinae TaxID=2970734 RepID=A0ABT2CP56_9ACTN|nr:polymorphic toxin-type HINT domain-containing protein [Streptomyces sp. LP05-1]MCS0639222.1 polymorphic toxin-type HINT domain-containing protein [Streptomyces sp. LP05-1]